MSQLLSRMLPGHCHSIASPSTFQHRNKHSRSGNSNGLRVGDAGGFVSIHRSYQ